MERKHLIGTAAFLAMTSSWTMAQPVPLIHTPDGFAGMAGTTGGGNADPIHVSSAGEFSAAVTNDNPKVVVVHGSIDVGGVSFGSNTTVVGADASAELAGGGFSVNGTNYIFQNLTMGPNGGDVMEVAGATKVFITRCTMHDAGDEILTMKAEADSVTISWCRFYFDNSHGHAFAHLIGSGNGATENRGKLNVTMHHNWYQQGVVGRMPRVRFGHVHIYNNFWNAEGNGYCIGIGVECHVRLENSHFKNVNAAWADYGGSGNGEIGWNNVIFEETSEPSFMPNAYSTIFEPPYSYTLDSADQVESIVTDPSTGSGNVVVTPDVIAIESGSAIHVPVVGDYVTYEWSNGLRVIVTQSAYRRMDGKSIRWLPGRAHSSAGETLPD